MAGSEPTARVTAAIAGLLEPLGYVVEDVAVTPAGRRRLVRVSVDRDTAQLAPQDHDSVVPPITLDDVAEATRVIGAALDEAEPLGDTPYVLEVTSPGVSRPLTEPRHFRRNVGRLVELTLADGTAYSGRLVSARPGLLTVAAPDGTRREQPLGEVLRGRVQIEFSHAADDHDDPADDPDDPTDAAADDLADAVEDEEI